MNKNTQELRTKTVCVGRFLIDVPVTATVSFRPAFVAGWNISVNTSETRPQFDMRLQQTLAELRSTRLSNGEPSLASITNIDSSSHFGKILVFGRDITSGFGEREVAAHAGVSIDGHVWIEGASFSLSGKSMSSRSVNEVQNLMRQLSPLTDSRIPEERGFCIGKGFIRDPFVAAGGEDVTLLVGLPGHPDVSIAIYTSSGRKPGTSLLVRSHRGKKTCDSAGHVRIARADHRMVANVQGDEIVELIKEQDGTRGQSFIWESQGIAENVYSPFVSIEMSTGHSHAGAPVMSSLRDAAAIAIWDRIVSSFRVRPTKSLVIAAPFECAALQ